MKNVKKKIDKTDIKKYKFKYDFFKKVYNTTKKIPYGKVSTYGDIAEACGIRSSARTVGWALNGCGPDIPAHRVVNRNGLLTGKAHFGGERMKELLESEGIQVKDDQIIGFKTVYWDPEKELMR